jgi:hypothetical protein
VSGGVSGGHPQAHRGVASRPAVVGVPARLARAPAWTITAVLGLAYLLAGPPSADLAAASYRSYLFGREGFTLWDNAWYGGHHLPAYSALAPALGWLVGPRLLAALSMTIAAALFAAVIEGRFPERATRLAAAWFALGAAIGLLSWRVPFDLGLAVGLGALLSAQRRRGAPALVLAALCALASPVAAAFLALAAVAWALAGPERAYPSMLAAAALAPVLLLALLFPEGGTQPFVASAFYPALAGVLLIGAFVPAEARALRIGVLLYVLSLAGAYVLATPVGGNVDRLGALVAGPLAACLLLGRSRLGRRALPGGEGLLLVLAPVLLYWQANAPVADFFSAAGDPSVEQSYYAPLLGELRTLGIGFAGQPARIEVVATRDHWEARWLAPQVMIARGWERQLDRYRDGLFYENARLLDASRYRAWLRANAISYVALPDAPLDYSAGAEARLLRGEYAGGDGAREAGRPPPYVHEVWRSAHWRLFAVGEGEPLAQPPSVLTQLASDSFTLRAPAPGAYVVRVHFTPYWALASGRGCVQRASGDWTQVRARAAGSFRVALDFSPGRVFDHGPRCR